MAEPPEKKQKTDADGDFALPASGDCESYRFTYYHPKMEKFENSLRNIVTVCIDRIKTNNSQGLPFTESIMYSSDKSIGDRKYTSKVVKQNNLYKLVASQAANSDDYSMMFYQDWTNQWEPPTPVLSMRTLVMLSTIGPFLTGLPSESGASEEGSLVGGKKKKRRRRQMPRRAMMENPVKGGR
ncbi:unnamed protein product [Sphagnum tenellum]